MAVDTLRDLVVERDDAPQGLGYDGEWGPLAGITVSNTLLSLLTLGVYRFWGKTRLRRYLWSRITFAGDRLEYVGTGKELFVGFCIAVVVLIPLTAVPLTVEILVPEDAVTLAVINLLQAAVLFFLIQVAIFRARRYRLSRTKWRGIRAGQNGSAVAYASLFFAWMLLALLTLFLAFPWARTALQRYRVTHSWFGNRKFSFKGAGRSLLAPWLLVWLPLFFGFGTVVLGVLGAEAAETRVENPWVKVVTPAFFLVAVVMYLRYRVAEFRYFVSCTRFDHCRFSSDLSTMRVFLVYLASVVLTVLAIVAITAGLLYLAGLTSDQFADLMAMILAGSEGGLAASGLQDIIMLVFLAWMVMVAMVVGIIRVTVTLHLMVRIVTASLTFSAAEDFIAAARNSAKSPAFGEGLADALDVGEIGF